MYTMILAEDEEIERIGLKRLLERQFDHLTILEAANGQELVEMEAQHHPDMVLVDIHMPVLSGLEAMEKIRQRGSQTYAIIYTAHGEFSYAQEALRHQVHDYLLKPARREKLMQTIQKALDAVEEQRKQAELVAKIRPTICQELMLSIMLGDHDMERLETYGAAIGLPPGSYYMMTFQMENDQEKSGIAMLANAVIQKEYWSYLARELEQRYNCITGQRLHNQLTCLVPLEAESGYVTRVMSIELARVLCYQMAEKKGVKLTVGIGLAYHCLRQMHDSYRESLQALHHPGGGSSVHHYHDVFGKETGVNPLAQCRGDVMEAIQQGDLRQCQQVLDRVYGQAHAMTSEEWQDGTLQLVLDVTGAMEQWAGIPREKRNTIGGLWQEVAGHRTAEPLKLWALRQFSKLIKQLESQQKQSLNRVVVSALRYMEDHLDQDLSMEAVAESIDVSPYYLSRLFKSELGETFVVHLTTMKMERAKLLLKKYQYSIKTVSEQLGYTSSAYFSKVFKKYTGKTVGEFKAEEG